MQVPNRFASIEDYRYGFQGQEKDDEIKGEGNSLNYTFRMHDPRVGRFFAVDPLFRRYPHYSPYSFSGNRVIDAVEIEGLEPHLLFDSLTEAANNFGNQYNGYSIRKNLEIGTQFYLVVDSDGTKKYAYTTPVYGEFNYVYPKNSNDIPDHAVSYVGDGHTHGKELESDKMTLYTKKEFSLRDTDEITTKYEIDKYLKKQKVKGMQNFYFKEGSNGPSTGDMSFWQGQINNLGENFFRSYLFTPSGLVYSVKNVDGKPIAEIQHQLSEITPSDENSRTRMNNVSSGLPEEEPLVLPKPGTEKVDPDKP
jgi:RHS repeat-associated protein